METKCCDVSNSQTIATAATMITSVCVLAYEIVLTHPSIHLFSRFIEVTSKPVQTQAPSPSAHLSSFSLSNGQCLNLLFGERGSRILQLCGVRHLPLFSS